MAAASAAAAIAALTVPIREGKAIEGTSSIVTEGEIDAGVESTGGGKDHVPCDHCRAYSDDHPRSQNLTSWAVTSFVPVNIDVVVLLFHG